MSLLKKVANKGPRLRCGTCAVFFRNEDLGASEDVVCSGCKASYHLHVFPAFARKPVSASHQDVLPLDNAHCYHAEDRKAVDKCHDCGRGVSEFMKVSLGGGRVTCLTCLQTHREDADEFLLETRRTATDNRALAFATVPMLVPFMTLFTAWITLVLLIKDWRSGRRSPMSPGGWKFKVAVALVVLQLGLWGLVIFSSNIELPNAVLMTPASSQQSMDPEMQRELEAAFEQAFKEAMEDSS